MKRRSFLKLFGAVAAAAYAGKAAALPDISATEIMAENEQTIGEYIDQTGRNPLLDDGPIPDIQPRDGFTQRWIRTSIAGEDDFKNMAKSYNVGWRRRDPSTVNYDVSSLTRHIEGVGNVIGVHGMILMEKPVNLTGSILTHDEICSIK